MRVVITGGKAKFVYDDGLHAALRKLGPARITRASSVEFDHDRGGWMVDLAPTCPGVVLGPFVSRTAALAAERDRVEEELSREVRP